jgi:hypothetical protein
MKMLAITLSLLLSGPAFAGQPTRIDTSDLLIPGTYTADESGCGFAIDYYPVPGGQQKVTDFTSGVEVIHRNYNKTLTNPDTGKTWTTHVAFRDEGYVDANGVWNGHVSGRSLWSMYAGDAGPFGTVQAPGLGVLIVGDVWFTWDPATNSQTSFSYGGTITDVCALLS